MRTRHISRENTPRGFPESRNFPRTRPRPGFSLGGRQTATVQLPKKVLDYFPTAPTLYLQAYPRAIVHEAVAAAANAVTRCVCLSFAVGEAASMVNHGDRGERKVSSARTGRGERSASKLDCREYVRGDPSKSSEQRDHRVTRLNNGLQSLAARGTMLNVSSFEDSTNSSVDSTNTHDTNLI